MTIVVENGQKIQDGLTADEQATLDELEVEAKEEEAKMSGERFDFDVEAQQRIAAHIVLDPEMMVWASNRVEPDYFTVDAHRLLVGTAQRLYRETGVMPTRDVVRIEIRHAIRLKTPEEQMRIETAMNLVYDYLYCLDEQEYVKRWISRFASRSRTMRAMFDYTRHGDHRQLVADLASVEDDGQDDYSALDAAEFLDHADDITEEWLIEDWLPRGALVLFAGEQKQGKSTLNFSLVAALVSGRDWWGHGSAPCPVVYLDWENPDRYLSTCLQRYLPRDDWEANRKRFIKPARLPRALTADWLRRFMTTNHLLDGEPGLIVVDSARRAFGGLFPGVPAWENSASEVDRALKPLQDLARETGWTILIVHHHNKSGGTSGSTDWEACPDFIWTYRQDGANRKLDLRGRLTQRVEPLVFSWDGQVVSKVGTASEAKAIEQAQQARTDMEKLLAHVPLLAADEVSREKAVTGNFLIGITNMKKTRVYELLREAEEQLVVSYGGGERPGSPRYYWRLAR